MTKTTFIDFFPEVADYIHKHITALAGGIQANHKLIWFGHMNYQRIALLNKALSGKGLGLRYIIDNNPKKWGFMAADKVLTLPPQQITPDCSTIVVVPPRHKNAMTEQLLSLGFPNEQIVILPTAAEFPKSDEKLGRFSDLRQMELRELQLCYLDILKALRDFCDANGLKYFIANGTLLGAVRHQGFIPWDTDIDVYMPFEDMQKFFSTYPNDNDSPYKTETWMECFNKSIMSPINRFVDSRAIRLNMGNFEFVYRVVPLGIGIVPLHGFPATPDEIQQRFSLGKELLASWQRWHRLKEFDSSIPDIREDILKLQNSHSFYHSPIVGLANGWFLSASGYGTFALPYSDFSESVLLKFEDDYFSAPVGYDSYLRTLYGDYMQLPPEDKRKAFTSEFSPYWL